MPINFFKDYTRSDKAIGDKISMHSASTVDVSLKFNCSNSIISIFTFLRYTKPESFADCIGNELPVGWEESYDSQIGLFYINHNNQCTQLEDPRLEWKGMQEEMLREYVTSAEDQLETKKEMYDIKQQRLLLAQDEYNHLNALATR